jgi:hypothetical protein
LLILLLKPTKSPASSAQEAEVLVGGEVVMALFFLVGIGIQTPGVPSEKYAQKHGLAEEQTEKKSKADEATIDFLSEHLWADRILKKTMIGFAVGFSVVIASTPRSLRPNWINTGLILVGIAVQLVSVVIFFGYSLAINRAVRRALR